MSRSLRRILRSRISGNLVLVIATAAFFAALFLSYAAVRDHLSG